MTKTTPVPTVSAQIWLDAPTSSLGWSTPPALVGAPPPLDIWTDMTQVMAHEPWLRAASQPQSLHYLCAVAPLDGVWADPSQRQVPVVAAQKARDSLEQFLADASWAIWPGPGADKETRDQQRLKTFEAGARSTTTTGDRGKSASTPSSGGPTSTRPSVARRACPGTSSPGPRREGPRSRTSFSRATRSATGLDTSCVESAVMSGRQAARALSGLHYEVPGERFFARLPADRPRGLPAFVGWKGLGQMSIPSPVVFDGCTAWAHVLPADRKALQALVDEKLNGPSDGALEVAVPFGVVLLVFLYGAKGSVPSEKIGCAQDREMCFVIPVLYEHAGLPHVALWMPYITVDTAIAMASGRETWGFAKEHGAVQPPEGTKLQSLAASSSALYFVTLDNDTLGTFGPIVTVVDDRGQGTRAAEVGGSQWRDRLFGFFETTAEAEAVAVAKELGQVFGLLGEHGSAGRVPVVNLKQFRDTVDDSRACYQAIDLTYFQLSDIHDFAMAEGAAHCDITKAESHDFVGILGLKGAQADPTGKKVSVPVPLTLGVSFTFEIASGTVLWKAG